MTTASTQIAVPEERGKSHTAPGHHLHPKYRPDIDGLRAVAIIAVLGFHAFPGWIQSGFIGVDVFFVISGFLISTIIFANFERDDFSYLDFYIRRVRRIFPALALVLAFCLCFGWFFLLPGLYQSLGKHTAAGAGFVANLVSWTEAGYFDKAENAKPLLHLWSLGVEEQFYLLWPVLIGICWRYRFNFLLVTVVVALASFGVNIFTAHADPTADFYSPISRFWELMIGGSLAYIALHKPQYLPKFSNLLSVLGLLTLAVGLLVIHRSRAFPGWWALLPSMGTALLIAAKPDAWLNKYLLGNRLMVAVGLISYPLYLWHLPLLVFARLESAGDPSPLLRALLLVASVMLAAATYLLVERPLRFRLPPKPTALGLVIAMAFVLLSGLAIVLDTGVPSRYPESLQPYFRFASISPLYYERDARFPACWLNMKVQPKSFSDDCVDPLVPGKPLILLWGDSHAARFYPGLRIVSDDTFRLAQYTQSACAPILKENRFQWCNTTDDFVIKKISLIHPDIVILTSRWSRHLSLRPGDRRTKKLLLTIAKLKQLGVEHIVLLGAVPNWKNELPENLIQQAVRTKSYSIPNRTSYMLDQSVAKIDQMMKQQFSDIPGVTYFSAYDVFCNASGCLTTVDGTANGMTTFDYGHLTTPAAVYLAHALFENVSIFRTVPNTVQLPTGNIPNK